MANAASAAWWVAAVAAFVYFPASHFAAKSRWSAYRPKVLWVFVLLLALTLTLGYSLSKTKSYGALGESIILFSGTSINCDNVIIEQDGNINLEGSIMLDGTRFSDTKNIRPAKFVVNGIDVYTKLLATCSAGRK